MRRLLIAIAIFALLIWGSLWSCRTVEATVRTVTAELEAGRIEDAYARWKTAQSTFGALLQHDEIDETDRLFTRVLAAQNSDKPEDSALDLAELLGHLRHLPELEKPSLKNLL